MQTEINVYADRVNQVPLYAVQGEYNSRDFIFNIIERDGTQLPNSNAEVINKMLDLTGYIPRLYILKPDNTVSFIEGNLIDAVGGKVSFTLSSQSVAAAGVSECNIILTSDNKDLRIIGINLTVNESIVNDGAVESDNDFSALQSALFTVSQYDNRIKSVEDRADDTEEQLSALSDRITPIEKGGTGANTADGAREALGAAPISHNHIFTDITGVLPVEGGGTGANTASEAYTELSGDTGWINASLSEMWADTNSSSLPPLRYRRIGNIVYVDGSTSRKEELSDFSSTQRIATLPTGFRPNHISYFYIQCSGKHFARGYINASGAIMIEWINDISVISTSTWFYIKTYFMIQNEVTTNEL